VEAAMQGPESPPGGTTKYMNFKDQTLSLCNCFASCLIVGLFINNDRIFRGKKA